MRTTTLHTRNVPPALKAQFKGYCARRGYTMEGAIMALMRRAVMADLALLEAAPVRRVNAKRVR